MSSLLLHNRIVSIELKEWTHERRTKGEQHKIGEEEEEKGGEHSVSARL